MLLSVHTMGAVLLKAPELAIDKTEAEMLAKATAQVAAHYDFVPDPKTQAWFNLFMVCGTIYGPRAFVLMSKHKKPAAPKPAPQPAPPPQNSPMEVPFDMLHPMQ